MLRSSFHQELAALEQELLRMGTMVEEAIRRSVVSLANLDGAMANEVLEGDETIDLTEIELEQRCMKLLALQQPLAGDLRTIATILKMSTDLERLADQATNIAEITLRLQGESLIKPLVDIPRMAELARRMVHDSLTAFIKRDVEMAKEICRRDEEVDIIYAALFEELVGFVVNGSEPRVITQAIHLIFVARYLERIADHATNIAERVVYMVSGEWLKLNGY